MINRQMAFPDLQLQQDPEQTMRQMALMQMLMQMQGQMPMPPEAMPEMPQGGEPTMRQQAIQMTDTPIPAQKSMPMTGGGGSVIPKGESGPNIKVNWRPTQDKGNFQRHSADLVEAEVQ